MVISRFTKGVVILNGAVPLTLLAWDALHNDLGANPVNFAIRTTGLLALIFLLLTLAVTPAISLTRWSPLGSFRRVFGLYAFFHATLHFGIFFFYDRAGNIRDTLSEIGLRPYLLVGIIGVVLMVPLAVTSTNRMISRLGPKRWKLLHRLTYLAVIAGVLHFYMLVKSDTTRPIIAASFMGAFFAYRLIEHYLRLRYDSYQYRHAPLTPVRELARGKQWTGSMRVAKMFQETQGVRTFRLVMPNGGKLPFEFLPGQYLILQLEIEGKMVRRSYTIASSPTQTGYCELTIKREDQGLVSRYLHDALQHEALVTVTAPAGRFTFSGMEADRIVMIAGGVGITPLMSKIRYLTDIAWKGSIHLIFSVKTEQDIIFRRELDQLQKRFPQLKVTVTLTRAGEGTWTGERGRITADFLTRVAPDLKMGRVHLCGPTEMTDPIVAMIRDLGVADSQIHVESFASPSRNLGGGTWPSAEPALADGFDESAATLKFARSGKVVTELGGRTILEIAEEQGISIPYDCRSGICGQCKIQLLAGSVTMTADDALDRVDRSKGIILSCQAHCRDDVVVDV